MSHSDQSSDLDAQARAWFVRQKNQPLSEDERRVLAEWLADNPAHRVAWRHVEKDWQTLDHFRNELTDELNKARRYRPEHRDTPKYFNWAVAAMVLVVFLPLLYFQGLVGTTQSWHTAVGEQRHIELAGGTLLSLDTATHVIVTQNWFKHQIDLNEGEIFVDVAPGWRKLQVTADKVHIRDIGTRFTVRHTANQFRVQVAEGAVEVKDEDENKYTLLHSGEELFRNPGNNEWRLAALSVSIANWRQGVLVFNEHRLSEVLEELARYHIVHFDLDDPNLGEKHVSGRFQLEELEPNLNIIAKTLRLTIEQPNPDLFILRAAQN